MGLTRPMSPTLRPWARAPLACGIAACLWLAATVATAQPSTPPPSLGSANVVSAAIQACDATVWVSPRAADDAFIVDANGLQFEVVVNGTTATIDEIIPHDRITAPVAYLLLIDQSTSMRSRMAEVQAAASLLVQMPGNANLIGIATFGSDFALAQDFTHDKSALQKVIANLAPTEKGTSLFDAIKRGLELFQRTDPGFPARRVIVVVSDAEDRDSVGSPQSLIQVEQRLPFRVSVSGLLTKRGKASEMLDALAQATAGAVVLLGRDTLTVAFLQLAKRAGDEVHQLQVSWGEPITPTSEVELAVTTKSGNRHVLGRTRGVVTGDPAASCGAQPVVADPAPTPAEPDPDPDPVPDPDVTGGTTPIPPPPDPKPTPSSGFPIAWVVAGVLVALIFVIGGLLLSRRSEPPAPFPPSPTPAPGDDDDDAPIDTTGRRPGPQPPGPLDDVTKRRDRGWRAAQPRDAAFFIRLVKVRGPGSAPWNDQTIPVGRSGIVFGRSAELPLIGDDEVSAQHCRIRAEEVAGSGGGPRRVALVLEDLKSTNGTQLNGRDVQGVQRLDVNDEIAIGGTVFRLSLESRP